ncbi:MAG: hypothetical protein QOJ59_3487 [Thermomicrobiales bacterium]|nr:hypothetical protein [Thermomicrobiales bacterium]
MSLYPNPGDHTATFPPPAVLGSKNHHPHTLQFYEADPALLDHLTHYIGAALAAGDAAVVIATEEHRRGLAERLLARGLDIVHAASQGRYISLDAAETMAICVPDGMPDAARFAELVGGVLTRATAAATGKQPRVAVFGELVALLTGQGRYEAALQLEGLWNDLAKTHAFSLHCAYPISTFGREEHGGSIAQICAAHSHVMPAESYSSLADDEQRLRSIALLQQKAQALEIEVAERKSAQESLRRREDELADFLENALEGVQQLGPDNRILWANRAQLGLLGYTADEYVNRPFGEYHVDRDTFEDFWQKLMRREDVYDYPADLRCKDGSVKHVLITANGRWDGDRFVHTRCFMHDVTQQRRMEEELRERNRELSAAVAARDEFLSVAAHELKTPITSLRIFAQLLLRDARRGVGTAPERLESALTAIELQTSKLNGLLTRLLDTAQIEAGLVRLDPVRTDLAALVRSWVGLQHIGADHQLIFEGPEQLHAVVDPVRFEQVVTNLLDNAVKFSPLGGTVTVELGQDDDGGIRLAVTDQGVGVPPDQREAVFNRLHQAHGEPHLSGMGLGLYITREIVVLHGGSLRIEEPGDRGSRFVVSLPPSAGDPESESAA